GADLQPRIQELGVRIILHSRNVELFKVMADAYPESFKPHSLYFIGESVEQNDDQSMQVLPNIYPIIFSCKSVPMIQEYLIRYPLCKSKVMQNDAFGGLLIHNNLFAELLVN